MYRLLLLDIDGTLRPNHMTQFPAENVSAIRAVQALGVKVAIATGRSVAGIPQNMLNGLCPDFWLCASGAQVATGDLKKIIRDERMDCRQVEAIMDCFENSPYPYGFAFSDGVYVYKDYEFMHEREAFLGGNAGFVNGESRDRHLQDMPVACFARCSEEFEKAYNDKYPQVPLRFLFYGLRDKKGFLGVDILKPDQDKAAGLMALSSYLNIPLSECVCAGDGSNDVGMLKIAGMSYAMADGHQVAMDAAKKIAMVDKYFGVEFMCREVWPEAFTVRKS